MKKMKERLGQSLAIAGLLVERIVRYAAMIALPVAMFTALCILFESMAGTVSAAVLLVATCAMTEKGR